MREPRLTTTPAHTQDNYLQNLLIKLGATEEGEGRWLPKRIPRLGEASRRRGRARAGAKVKGPGRA